MDGTHSTSRCHVSGHRKDDVRLTRTRTPDGERFADGQGPWPPPAQRASPRSRVPPMEKERGDGLGPHRPPTSGQFSRWGPASRRSAARADPGRRERHPCRSDQAHRVQGLFHITLLKRDGTTRNPVYGHRGRRPCLPPRPTEGVPDAQQPPAPEPSGSQLRHRQTARIPTPPTRNRPRKAPSSARWWTRGPKRWSPILWKSGCMRLLRPQRRRFSRCSRSSGRCARTWSRRPIWPTSHESGFGRLRYESGFGRLRYESGFGRLRHKIRHEGGLGRLEIRMTRWMFER